jgi:phosphoglycerate dehydrogenase-like enzyme
VRAGPLLATYGLDASERTAAVDALGGIAELVCLTDLPGTERADALRRAGALLSRNIGQELTPDELSLIRHARLIQFVTAGVDHIPVHLLPPGLPAAANRGAYAEPMAEHAVAMALAAAKRLFVEHAALARGAFNQFTPNRMLSGGVCGILGFGGIGRATARLMRGLGMRIHAINRRGADDERPGEPIDWIGRPAQLATLLAAADLLVICTPLTRATAGLIDARALECMKQDAILINLARGEIIDEAALYAHLKAHPSFTACLDAWWVEPIRHGAFRMDQPFLDLPNVIGSPHNSASVGGWRAVAVRRAAENCRRALAGEPPWHLITADDQMT